LYAVFKKYFKYVKEKVFWDKLMENFAWINLILGVELVGIVIIVMQYLPALRNKIPLRYGVIIVIGAIITKIGFYVNYFLFT